MVSAHYLKTIYHRAFKFNMLISLGDDTTCIDFGFTRSNVKVTGVILVKQWFPLIILKKYLSQSYYISHADWFW